MLPLALLFAFALPAAGESARAPRLDVLEGKVRVFATEAWIELAPGETLPPACRSSTLRLPAGARARLSGDGASVELRGPLLVESGMLGPWTVGLSGSGAAHVDALRASVRLELEGGARLDLARGVYWAEGRPDGDWRAGCDAGLPIAVRPPAGRGWPGSPRVASGASIVIVGSRSQTAVTPAEERRATLQPWSRFSWPWETAPHDCAFPARSGPR